MSDIKERLVIIGGSWASCLYEPLQERELQSVAVPLWICRN